MSKKKEETERTDEMTSKVNLRRKRADQSGENKRERNVENTKKKHSCSESKRWEY